MSRPTPTDTLATAVARLLRALRAAMLAALLRERIIAGAYVDADGMCPLLGAHRYGVRQSGEAFVDAWDRFCRVRRGRGRDATDSERAVLTALLEASLFSDRRVLERAAPRPVPACRLGIEVGA
jgi:hypothetical protein